MMKIKNTIILLCSVSSFCIPLNLFAQSTKQQSDRRLRVHHESVDDKYFPPSGNNKKVSPSYKYRSPVQVLQMSSTISTTQVNVNVNGQNILDDAGNEPNIAVNPINANEIVIGWRQFDDVTNNFRQAGWSYSADAGQTWTFPGVLEQGIFRSDPVLDYDASGNFYYNSLTLDNLGNFLCKVFKSTDGGASWNNGVDAGGGDKQWMAIDRGAGTGGGNIYSFWTSSFSSCLPGFFTRSIDTAQTFEPCTEVDGDPSLGTMAVGSAGELYISGFDDFGAGIIVSKSTNAQVAGSVISWDTTLYVDLDGALADGGANPAGLLGQANIDVDRSTGPGQGNVYVLASVIRNSNLDPADVMFARSTDGGITWSAPVRINDDVSTTNTQWFGTMSVAPNGRIDVVWLDTRDAQPGLDSSSLYYSYSVDQGFTWSANERMSAGFDPHLGYPNQDKMGDYFDMISDNSGAHLAWANTLNGEEDVYYSHIIPQVIIASNGNTEFLNLSIYPNPSTGFVAISGVEKNSRIEVYTMLGEKRLSVNSIGSKNEIDISSQPAGVYILKVVNQNGSSMIRKISKDQ